MLLLKTLAQECDLNSLTRILDVGCGVGSLGLALAACCPGACATLVDRDYLAVKFSAHNAQLNNLNNVSCLHRLMLEGPHSQPFDLILSNFPAKAGDTVLAHFLRDSINMIRRGGRGAIVVIQNLANRCQEIIQDSDASIIYKDESKQHAVFHYTSKVKIDDESRKPVDFLYPYIRHHGEFRIKRTRYTLETVWNISDFDNLSWRIKIMGELLDGKFRHGKMMFLSPGQGHLPLLCAGCKGAKPTKIVLVGRDRLELLISHRNLKNSPLSAAVEIRPVCDLSLLNEWNDCEPMDLLLTDIFPIPGSDWVTAVRQAAKKLVKITGEWAIVGRSSDIASLTKSTKGWTATQDKRHHGWRALILRRNS